MSLPDRIEKRLIATDLNRAEASKRAGLNPTYIRDLLKGRVKNPRSEHLARLADVLGTTLEWLAEGRGPEVVGAPVRDRAKVLDLLDRIPEEDFEHAMRALKGFARDAEPDSKSNSKKSRKGE